MNFSPSSRRPQGIAPTIHGLVRPIRRIVGLTLAVNLGRGHAAHLLLHPLREQKEWLSIEPRGFHGVLVDATTGRRAPAASSPAPPPRTARSTGSSPPRCAASH